MQNTQQILTTDFWANHSPQFYNNQRKAKQFKHLISLEDLNADLIWQILHATQNLLTGQVPDLSQPKKIVTHVFFENSTRTKTTFELAATKLGLHNQSLNIQTSSSQKGESLIDTIANLTAMHSDLLVVRHQQSGAAHVIANYLNQQHLSTRLINAGDGQYGHPTQGLLDMYTIWQHKQNFNQLSVAIVGDILHSRVARSDIFALSHLACPDIRVIAPPTLLPDGIESWGVNIYHDLKQGLKNVDVIIMLRLQKERMESGLLPFEEYFNCYGLTEETLAYAKKDAIVMHPGPINRNVEIASNVADGRQSVILKQVHYGLYVRMAVMQYLLQKP